MIFIILPRIEDARLLVAWSFMMYLDPNINDYNIAVGIVH
jgi:hypothetical protein